MSGSFPCKSTSVHSLTSQVLFKVDQVNAFSETSSYDYGIQGLVGCA